MLSLALSALSLNNAPLRAGRAPTKASVSMKVEDLVGGINDPIFGGTPEGKIFDPLGLGKDEASLYRRRVVEIKHGRICMVAFLGMTVGPNDVRRSTPQPPPPLPLPPPSEQYARNHTEMLGRSRASAQCCSGPHTLVSLVAFPRAIR